MNSQLNPHENTKQVQENQFAKTIWDTALPYIKKEVSPIAFDSWISHIEPVRYDGAVFVVATTPMNKDVVVQEFLEKIQTILSESMMKEIKLDIISLEEMETKIGMISKPEDEDEPDTIIGDYTFDNFVVGQSNCQAHACAKGVASQVKYVKERNPLFIHGASGLGKTHLLYAICNEVKKNFPDKKIHYTPGEAWLTEFLSSLSNNTQQEFKKKYRTLDLLIIDDVHFFAGKPTIQEELFNTFNELYTYKKQIVFTSDRHPSELDDLEKRLVTRFQSGVVIDVKSPDYETRMAIVQKKATAKGVPLPHAILELIAENITDNVRQIEGMVNRLLSYNDLNYSPAGAPSEKDILSVVKEILEQRSQIVPTNAVIIKEVCNYYEITDEQIRGKSRAADVVLPRNIAIYLIRELIKPSLSEIGKEFGGRDHTTIMNSLNSLEKKILKDTVIKTVIEDIKRNINNKFYSE